LTNIPAEDNILRHVANKHIDRDESSEYEHILGSAFISRPRDEGSVSYNWMEFFKTSDEKRVAEVRARARLQYKKSGRLVSLNVGKSLASINQEKNEEDLSKVLQDILPETTDHPEDASHCVMTKIPDENEALGELIGDLLSRQVTKIYPALPE
jgi:hypothetical protein